jgi:hypothetical protein
MVWNELTAHVSELSELAAALRRATDDDLTVARFTSPSGGEIRFVLKPDRRRVADRRRSRRGGRRTTDVAR